MVQIHFSQLVAVAAVAVDPQVLQPSLQHLISVMSRTLTIASSQESWLISFTYSENIVAHLRFVPLSSSCYAQNYIFMKTWSLTHNK